MSIRSKALARACRDWLVGFAAVGFVCLLVWEVSRSLVASICVGIFGVWVTWRFVAGSPRGPVIELLHQWEEDFRSRFIVSRGFRSAAGELIKGVGAYGGRTLVMKAKVDARGLLLQLPGGLGTTSLEWRDISTIREANFDFGGDLQLVADLLLRDISHQQLFVPWKEEFRRFVPGSVGLETAGLETKRVSLI